MRVTGFGRELLDRERSPSTVGLRLLDEQRPPSEPQYMRIQPDATTRSELRRKGFTWVLSSNVSGIKTEGFDLLIRFWNGSVYRYFDRADLFDPMLQSNSKGRFVWDVLRRPAVPFEKMGSMALSQDRDQTDDELFRNIDVPSIPVIALESLVIGELETMISDIRII